MRNNLRDALPPTVAVVTGLLLPSALDVGIVKSLIAALVAGAVMFWLMYALNNNPYVDEADEQEQVR